MLQPSVPAAPPAVVAMVRPSRVAAITAAVVAVLGVVTKAQLLAARACVPAEMTMAFSAVKAVPVVRAGGCAGGVSMVAPSRTVNITVAVTLPVALTAVMVTATAPWVMALAAPVMAQELVEVTTAVKPAGRLAEAVQPLACTLPPVLANTSPSAVSSFVSVAGVRLASTGAVNVFVVPGVAGAAALLPPPQAASTIVSVAASKAGAKDDCNGVTDARLLGWAVDTALIFEYFIKGFARIRPRR